MNYQPISPAKYRPVIWAVVPVKPLRISKMRLAHLLSEEQRADLIAGFLTKTLITLCQIPELVGVCVVTSDLAVQALAKEHGAQVLAESAPEGLNVAVDRGVRWVSGAGAQGVLVLPADLPFVTRADVQQMLASLPGQEGGGNGNGRFLMTICSDAAQQGTNALLLYPPVPFTFHYGQNSYHHHLKEARRLNRTVYTIQAAGLQFDLDIEADWFRYQKTVSEKQQLALSK